MNIYPIPDNIRSKLLTYQIDHVDGLIYSLRTYNRALDASDTGTGKTYAAIASCLSMNLKALIICPKSVITSWTNVLDQFNSSYYGVANYETIQNCKYFTKLSKREKVKCPFIKKIEKKKESKNEYKTKKSNNPKIDKKDKDYIEYSFVWENLPDDLIVIFDETHRCKNPRTNNSVMLYSLALTKCKILMLSATCADKPDTFILTGYVLGLYKNIRQAKNWMLEVGKGYDNIMSGVHNTIYPEHANRMRIRDLKGLFPNNHIICSCFDMDNAEEIEKQYKLIEDEIKRLKEKEKSSSCALSRILYARMTVESLKIPTFIELAKKHLKEGYAVAIFVNFTQSLMTIAEELKTSTVIHGQQSLDDRNKSINDFNNDKSQIIVCNIKSGGCGISLQDLTGLYPRISIISPSWSAQDIIQCLGRVHRANGKTPVQQKIIFCSNTIEEQICQNMKEKINNIFLLNDGDLLSMNIIGLTDDQIGIDENANLSEFDKLFLRITTLNVKKERLENDIKQVNEEIEKLALQINNLVN